MKFATTFQICLLLLSCEARVAAIHPVANSAALTSQAGELVRGPLGRSQIALTFEAGGDADCFEDLIAALAGAQAHSTFFITGRWAQRHPDCVAAITAHGHEVGNHTWNHLDLTKQPDAVVGEEILRAEKLFAQLTGQSPRPRWGAPYGSRERRILRIANALG